MLHEHFEQVPGRTRHLLTRLLGRTATQKTATNEPVAPSPGEASTKVVVTNTQPSLELFLRNVGLLGTDGDTVSRHMAVAIANLPNVQVPDGLSIVRIEGPGIHAQQYHLTVGKSLNSSHSHVPYVDPRGDETHKGYYLGVYSDGVTSTPVGTMEVADYGRLGEVAIVNNVTTAPEWRGKRFAAAMVTSVLKSDYGKFPVAFLSSTPEGEALYQKLGFMPVGEEAAQ